MPTKLNPELPLPWVAFFDELDVALCKPVQLHCIGGFVISQQYGFSRPTADVDYIAAVPHERVEELEQLAGRESKLAVKHKVYLQYVTVATMPEEYESRLKELFPGRFEKLKIFAPDTPTILHYPSSNETAQRTKEMSSTWQKLCRSTPKYCRIAMIESYGPTSWPARVGMTEP